MRTKGIRWGMDQPEVPAIARPVRRSKFSGRFLVIWVGLLAAAQCTDLVTTELNRWSGGIEANEFAAFVLMVGGAGLFLTLKLAVVAGMGAAALVALRYRHRHPGERAERCLDVVARTLQGSVALLTVTALSNAHVAAEIAASAAGPT